MRYGIKSISLRAIWVSPVLFIIISMFLSLPAFAGSEIRVQKAAELEKAAVENPRNYSETLKYIKFLSKRAKQYSFKRDYEHAADDLRAILYIIKEPKGSPEYTSYCSRLDNALNKMKFSFDNENRFEVAKNLYLEKKYMAAGYEFRELIAAKYEMAACYEYLGDISQKLKLKDLALNYYLKSLELENSSAQVNYKLAKLYDERTEEDLAQERYYDAVTFAPDASILCEIVTIYEAKIAKNPKNSTYYETLGRAYQELGEYDKTYPLYQKAIELNPQDIFLQYSFGTLLQEMGEYHRAIAVYDNILSKNPYESQIRTAKAKCLSATHKDAAAVKEYQIVLALYPDSMSAKYGIYKILSPKAGMEKAIAAFYPLEPNFVPNSEFYFDFALFLDKMGQYKDAEKAYIIATEKNKNNAKAYLALYDFYMTRNNDARAFEVAQEGYKNLPNNADIRKIYSSVNQNTINKKSSLALSYIKNNDYEKALMIYKEIEPKTVGVYVSMANCHKLLKDYPKAIETMGKAIKLDPTDSDLYYVMSLIYLDKKDNDGALVQLTKSISLDKNNIKAIKLANYLVQKNISDTIDKAYDFYSKGNYSKALETLYTINKRYPKDPQPYYYIGLAYEGQKKYPEALENYRMALKYNKNYDVVYFAIGQLLEKYGKGKEALESYERFLAGDSDDAEMIKKAQQRVIELSKKYY